MTYLKKDENDNYGNKMDEIFCKHFPHIEIILSDQIFVADCH